MKHKHIIVQSIGWASLPINESTNSANDYDFTFGRNDPYNDDTVVDDLYDQWRTQYVHTCGCPEEDLQLAFELGAHVALKKRYDSEDGRTIQVTDKQSKEFQIARIAALREVLDVTAPEQGLKDAFEGGYDAILAANQQ